MVQVAAGHSSFDGAVQRPTSVAASAPEILALPIRAPSKLHGIDAPALRRRLNHLKEFFETAARIPIPAAKKTGSRTVIREINFWAGVIYGLSARIGAAKTTFADGRTQLRLHFSLGVRGFTVGAGLGIGRRRYAERGKPDGFGWWSGPLPWRQRPYVEPYILWGVPLFSEQGIERIGIERSSVFDDLSSHRTSEKHWMIGFGVTGEDVEDRINWSLPITPTGLDVAGRIAVGRRLATDALDLLNQTPTGDNLALAKKAQNLAHRAEALYLSIR